MEVDLHSTTDAKIWAKRFIEAIESNVNTADPHDEGFMIGWFANAIETGREAGRKELEPF